LTFNSSNTACQMIYRHVIDVTETSPFNGQDGNWSRLFTSGYFSEGQKNDIFLEENEIATSVPSYLLYYGEIDDSLDAFKRVRLFTRWQDAEESRSGKLFTKVGKVSLWSVAGPAAEVCTQMRQNLFSEAFGTRREISTYDYKPCDEKEREKLRNAHFFAVSFFFLGTCRRKARPIVTVYSKDKYVRHDVVRGMRGLDWFHPNKSGVVATTWCNPVKRQQIIEDIVRYGGWDRGFAEEVL
jgi:hypothetical protein